MRADCVPVSASHFGARLRLTVPPRARRRLEADGTRSEPLEPLTCSRLPSSQDTALQGSSHEQQTCFRYRTVSDQEQGEERLTEHFHASFHQNEANLAETSCLDTFPCPISWCMKQLQVEHHNGASMLDCSALPSIRCVVFLQYAAENHEPPKSMQTRYSLAATDKGPRQEIRRHRKGMHQKASEK